MGALPFVEEAMPLIRGVPIASQFLRNGKRVDARPTRFYKGLCIEMDSLTILWQTHDFGVYIACRAHFGGYARAFGLSVNWLRRPGAAPHSV